MGRLAKLLLVSVVVLLGACAAYVEGSKVRTNSKAIKQSPPLGQFLDVNGTQVHVLVEGSGPDLVLIHGAGGNLRDFTYSMVDKLTDDFRVIAFDRPGHGYTARISDRAELGETPREQAALLSAAATQLGVKDAVILGHSFGGAVSMAWAIHYPEEVRAVVMVAGVSNEWEGGLGDFYTNTTTFFGRNVLVPLMSTFATRQRIDSAAEGIFAPDPVPEGYVEHMGINLSKSTLTLQATTQQVGFVKPHVIALEKRYGDLTIPIEIVHGTADTTVPLEVHGRVLASQTSRANLTVLDGVGHMPQHAAEAQVIAAIKRAADRAGLQ